ncbi:hypothetical protein GCM10008013_34370 [Paenibacillus segetis]|uniref:Uncharacterized protein n=1 Tax=Paenibacillus segetis TaxID=1325360 RepID=A0ABQ1YNC1_9BACL|nr:hypothetical protein GCM10008013_34370 [Paenibacillus segetis]
MEPGGSSWGDIVGYMDVYSNIIYIAFTLCVFLFMKSSEEEGELRRHCGVAGGGTGGYLSTLS